MPLNSRDGYFALSLPNLGKVKGHLELKHISGVLPKALERRIAISGETPDLPFTRKPPQPCHCHPTASGNRFPGLWNTPSNTPSCFSSTEAGAFVRRSPGRQQFRLPAADQACPSRQARIYWGQARLFLGTGTNYSHRIKWGQARLFPGTLLDKAHNVFMS